MDPRVALFVCFVVFAAFAAGAPQKETEPAPAAAAAANTTYTTKYDKIDVDQVLSSRRLVGNYVQCLLDKKPCTPEGAELRSTHLYRLVVVHDTLFIS